MRLRRPQLEQWRRNSVYIFSSQRSLSIKLPLASKMEFQIWFVTFELNCCYPIRNIELSNGWIGTFQKHGFKHLEVNTLECTLERDI